MWERVIELLDIGCRRHHLSLPFSPAPPRSYEISSRNSQSAPRRRGEIYVVCLECGRHFDYDWSHMRMLK
jgi:hypothetical protein